MATTVRQLLGYKLSFSAWGFMLPDEDKGLVCPKCESLLDPNYLNAGFKVKKRNTDAFETYDRYLIVSERLRDFCHRERYTELDFIPLAASKGFYVMKVLNTVEFKVTPFTHRDRFCEECRRFAEVWGFPMFPQSILKNTDEPLPDGFLRTDIEFGFKYFSPLLLVGIETKKKIRAEKLRGFSFIEVKS